MCRCIWSAVLVHGLAGVGAADNSDVLSAVPVSLNEGNGRGRQGGADASTMRPSRVWTNRAGTQRAWGVFQAFNWGKGVVLVRKSSGVLARVRFDDLSDADRWYVVSRELDRRLARIVRDLQQEAADRLRAFAQTSGQAAVAGFRTLITAQVVRDQASEALPPPPVSEDPLLEGLRAVGQAIVCFVPGRERAAIQLCERLGLVVLETYGPGHFIVCSWPQRHDLRASVSALLEDRSILYVDPNYVIRLEPVPPHARLGAAAARWTPAVHPNDPRYRELWGMARIRAPQVWSCFRTTTIVVAVSDTGMDLGHQDLRANLWINPFERPGDGLDNDGNGVVDDVVHGYNAITGGGQPLDDNGHGTHVAGTIGAVGNNKMGVVGVNWNVKIMAVKCLDASGNGTFVDAIKTIDYAWRNGANVINTSWGAPVPRATVQSLRDAIGRAESAGVVIVAAAGNNGMDTDTTPFYPAAFADPNDPDGAPGNLISVAAVDAADALASFSNFGRRSVHVAAPGVDILSTIPGNQYGFNSGTSMAAPHVAGAVALVWGQAPYRTLRARQIKGLLLSRAQRVPRLAGRCATEAVLNLSSLCPIVPGAPCPPINRCPPYPCRPFCKYYRPWMYTCR